MKNIFLIVGLSLLSIIANAQTYYNSGYTGAEQDAALLKARDSMLTTSAPLNIISTTALESASLGTEQTDGTGWTSTDWTGAYNSFTHTVGNTTTLTRTMTNTIGQLYYVSFTISGRTAGNVTVDLGGQNSIFTYSNNATHRFAPKVISTDGALNFNPTTDFDGTIASISVKQITGTYAPSYIITNSGGGNSFETRSSSNGLNNTFIGDDAGNYNIGGYNNTALGSNSLYSTTTGFNNSAFGFYSLNHNTTGFNNSAFGNGSLNQNTTGVYNSAFGLDAMSLNTTGAYNSALGMDALYSNISGNSNTALGYYSLHANTSGWENSGVGLYALLSNTTGHYNTAMGNNSLQFLDGGMGNSAFGYYAGNKITTGSFNTLVGDSAGRNLTTGSYNIAIGRGDTLFSATGSNQLSIGNILYGDLSNGRIGLGIGNPSEMLEIRGDTNPMIWLVSTADAFYQAGLQAHWDGQHQMSLYGSNLTEVLGQYGANTALPWGNVGIGNTNPGTWQLNVTNDVYVGDTISYNVAVDRTPGYTGENGIGDLMQIKTLSSGEIDHESLPEFVRAYYNENGIMKPGRNIGNMISLLVDVCQKQQAKIENLELRLAKIEK